MARLNDASFAMRRVYVVMRTELRNARISLCAAYPVTKKLCENVNSVCSLRMNEQPLHKLLRND